MRLELKHLTHKSLVLFFVKVVRQMGHFLRRPISQCFILSSSGSLKKPGICRLFNGGLFHGRDLLLELCGWWRVLADSADDEWHLD